MGALTCTLLKTPGLLRSKAGPGVKGLQLSTRPPDNNRSFNRQWDAERAPLLAALPGQSEPASSAGASQRLDRAQRVTRHSEP